MARRPSTRVDLLSLAGLPLGLALVVGGHLLEGGSIGSLLQGTAALIVFGGTIGAVLLSFSAREVRGALTSLRSVFVDDLEPSAKVLDAFGGLSVKARKNGILSLDDELERIADPFLRRGLRLAVDGTNPTTLRHMLEAENDAHLEREEAPARVYEAAGGYAPTVGILGANLVLLPIASKLRARATRRARRRDLITEGVLAIQEGQNPRLIDQKMRGLLAAKEPAPASNRRRRAA